jgi:hypothetical protein
LIDFGWLVRDALRRMYVRPRKASRVPTFDEALGTKTKHPSRRFRSGTDDKPVTYKKATVGPPKDTETRRKAWMEQVRQDAERRIRLLSGIRFRKGIAPHG